MERIEVRPDNLRNVVEKHKANLSGAIFHENLGAQELRQFWDLLGEFEEVDLSGAEFQCRAYFFGEFPFSLNLKRSRFLKGAAFRNATFRGDVVFRDAFFGENTYIRKTRFLERADFSWASFGDNLEVSETFFGGEATFSGASFGLRANFFDVVFKSKASFSWATFGDNSGFENVGFEEADFSDCEFESRAAFFGCYTKEISFERANLGTRFQIDRECRLRRANLSGATVGDGSILQFCDGLCLKQGIVEGYCRVETRALEISDSEVKGTLEVELVGGNPEVQAQNLRFSSDGRLLLRSKTHRVSPNLKGTPIFDGALRVNLLVNGERSWESWPVRPNAWDEEGVGKLAKDWENRGAEEMTRIYRQLRMYKESQEQFEEAGLYYIGEMLSKMQSFSPLKEEGKLVGVERYLLRFVSQAEGMAAKALLWLLAVPLALLAPLFIAAALIAKLFVRKGDPLAWTLLFLYGLLSSWGESLAQPIVFLLTIILLVSSVAYPFKPSLGEAFVFSVNSALTPFSGVPNEGLPLLALGFYAKAYAAVLAVLFSIAASRKFKRGS